MLKVDAQVMSSNDFYTLRAQWKRQVKSLFKLPVNGSFSPRKQDISLIRCHLNSQRRHCFGTAAAFTTNPNKYGKAKDRTKSVHSLSRDISHQPTRPVKNAARQNWLRLRLQSIFIFARETRGRGWNFEKSEQKKLNSLSIYRQSASLQP